jgi:hypothetical protein
VPRFETGTVTAGLTLRSTVLALRRWIAGSNPAMNVNLIQIDSEPL